MTEKFPPGRSTLRATTCSMTDTAPVTTSEDWNSNDAEAMASVVELVCRSGSSVSLNDLRHLLAGLYNKRKQHNGSENYDVTALTADYHLARKWVSRTHQDLESIQRSTTTVVHAFRTPPFNHGEEHCDDQAELDTSIENIHQDLKSNVHNNLIDLKQGLLSPSNSRCVKESPAPAGPQLNPRKRTRLALSPDDELGTEPQDTSSSPDLGTDLEMNRIESSRRISINRQISILQERMAGTESVKNMCLKEKEEKQREMKRIDEYQWQALHDEAIRLRDLPASRLETAEKFAEVILSAIVEFGEECLQPHDVLVHSQEEVMKADKAKEAAKAALESLENDLKGEEEHRIEVRDRITTLQMAIDDYDCDIAKDEMEKQDLLIQLASLNILCSSGLHTAPIEKRDALLSALHDVLGHITVQE